MFVQSLFCEIINVLIVGIVEILRSVLTPLENGITMPKTMPTFSTKALTSGLKLSASGTEVEVSKGASRLVTFIPAVILTAPSTTSSLVSMLRDKAERPFKAPFFRKSSPSKLLLSERYLTSTKIHFHPYIAFARQPQIRDSPGIFPQTPAILSKLKGIVMSLMFTGSSPECKE